MHINILFCKFTKETSLRDHFCDLQLGNMYSVMSVGLLNSETWTKCGHVDSLCGLGRCFRDDKIGKGKIKKQKGKKGNAHYKIIIIITTIIIMKF